MHCLNHINHAKIPNDIIKLYLEIYPFIGRNKEMLATVSRDFDVLLNQTIRLDSYFLAVMLNLKIPENRLRQIINKNSQPKNKDERLLKNIKMVFEKMHDQSETFNLLSTEVFDLLKFLFRGVEVESTLQFAKVDKKKTRQYDLLSSSHPTKREDLEELINKFKVIAYKSDFEISFVIVNFYIDFINLKPFSKHNEVIGLMLLYILLIQHSYKCLHLNSIFELLFKQQINLEKHIKEASHNWSEGLADVMSLHRFLLELLLESYQGFHELLRNYTYDQQTNKSDYIENTINKLNDVFSKEEIRATHPTISESTINRTLKRLRDEKKIRPLGKGRSAKWMKLYPSPKKASLYEQIKLKV